MLVCGRQKKERESNWNVSVRVRAYAAHKLTQLIYIFRWENRWQFVLFRIPCHCRASPFADERESGNCESENRVNCRRTQYCRLSAVVVGLLVQFNCYHNVRIANRDWDAQRLQWESSVEMRWFLIFQIDRRWWGDIGWCSFFVKRI